jgi:hypothetical protein
MSSMGVWRGSGPFTVAPINYFSGWCSQSNYLFGWGSIISILNMGVRVGVHYEINYNGKETN